MLLRVQSVLFSIISIFVLTQAELAEINFKLSLRLNKLKCQQNLDRTIEEFTIEEGQPLKIDVDYGYYINYIQCTDHYNSSRVFVWSPTKIPKLPLTVPHVTMEMDGLWTCTIFTHKGVKWLYPVALYNGSYYSAAYCTVKMNVKPAEREQEYLDLTPPEEITTIREEIDEETESVTDTTESFEETDATEEPLERKIVLVPKRTYYSFEETDATEEPLERKIVSVPKRTYYSFEETDATEEPLERKIVLVPKRTYYSFDYPIDSDGIEIDYSINEVFD